MAEVHSQRGKAPVPPHLYGHWVQSLIAAIREHDPQITPALESRWEKAMDRIVGHFTSRY